MSRFKVGDLVICYHGLHFVKSSVDQIDEDEDNSFILASGNWYHEKQCRKLIIKPKKSERDLVVEGIKWAYNNPVYIAGNSSDELHKEWLNRGLMKAIEKYNKSREK